MPNAIALQSIQFNLARIIGPVLGGLALTQLGEMWCFGLNALSFLAPIISLLMIKTRFLPKKTTESIWVGVTQGLTFIRKQSSMEGLMVLAFCMTALGVPMMTFLPFFAKNVFRQGPTIFTFFLCASGAGSIAGALTVAWLGNLKNKGRIALVMLICLGAGISGFALSTSIWFSCLMLFVSGVSLISVFTLVNSLVQLITPNEMRGRVMSVYNFAFRGGMPFGNLLTGRLIPFFTAPVVLAVNGVLLMAVALYFLAVQRRVARL
jgi:predicted MFS family arabinose efflux permease